VYQRPFLNEPSCSNRIRIFIVPFLIEEKFVRPDPRHIAPPHTAPPHTAPPHTAPNPWQLRGETRDDADVTGKGQGADPRQGIQSSEPKVWYARWGQAISGFFSSIGDKFTALWRGVSNAADAVARFFSGRGAESSVNVATMHIKETPTHSQQETSGATQLPQTPIIYFPVPENTKNEDVPEERRGQLGAIPVKPSLPTEDTEKTEVVKLAPAPISSGQKRFEAYLAARREGADLQEYVLDEECLQYAEQVSRLLFIAQSTPGYKPPNEERVTYDAAKELRSANSDYKNRIKEEEQKKQKEVERIRQAEEAASKQPGQEDFEEFVAAFDSHRADNTPFRIYDGSKYLHEACIKYGLANSENLSTDRKQALEYLAYWHKNPQGAKQRLEGARQFVNLPQAAVELTQPEVPAPLAVLAEPLQADASASVEMVASPPPPPRPAPRWTSILAGMKAWEPQQIKGIAGMLAMQEDQVRKAMDGLRTIAKMASASGAPAVRKAGDAQTIEQTLNYDADANRRASDLLDSLEHANGLVKKLKAGDAPVFDKDEQAFFSQLGKVIDNVAEALDKKLKELLPITPSSAAKEKMLIPSLLELSDEQARVGMNLFQTYVDGYTKRSNSVNYRLPEGSNYFKPECLAFAKAFTEQVGSMPPGAEVDTDRLTASLYLLDQARKRGFIEG
jgi:hypothetical protein